MQVFALIVAIILVVQNVDATPRKATPAEIVSRQNYARRTRVVAREPSSVPLRRAFSRTNKCDGVRNLPAGCNVYANVAVKTIDPTPIVVGWRQINANPVKRAVDDLLSPAEMALFLVGKGRFKRGDGSMYRDPEYSKSCLFYAAEVAGRSWHVQAIRDAFGVILWEHTHHFLRRWIVENLHSDDQVLAFSSRTGILIGDLPKLAYTLLEDPKFTALQVGGYRFTRRTIHVIASRML